MLLSDKNNTLQNVEVLLRLIYILILSRPRKRYGLSDKEVYFSFIILILEEFCVETFPMV